MDKVIIRTRENNVIEYTPAKKEAGKFLPCSFQDSIIAYGSTCSVFLALKDDQRYLIKKYEGRYNGTRAFKKVSKIKDNYNAQGDNYLMHEQYDGVDPKNKDLHYKVFDYKEGHVVTKYEGKECIISDIEKAYEIVLDFLSFLNCLKLLHADNYLHLDIKPANVFVLKVNSSRIVQLIDMDGVMTKQDLCEKKVKCSEPQEMMPTSNTYYSPEDMETFFDLSAEESSKHAYVLDTTATAKMFFEMLFGDNQKYGHWNSEVFLKSAKADSGKANLAKQLREFFDKGINNPFKERFCSVDEMIQRISDISTTVVEQLPVSVRTAKLKAQLRIQREKSVKDIDMCILPWIETVDRSPRDKYKQANNQSPLERLMQEKKFQEQNIFITGEGGFGKTSSLRREYYKNIENLEDNELYVYAPFKEYLEKDSLLSFIERAGSLSIDNLKRDSSRMTVFLDAYDENPIRKQIHQNKEIEKFDIEFFESMRKFSENNNIRFVVTSRVVPQKKVSASSVQLPKEYNFVAAKCLPLSRNQIAKYLEKDGLGFHSLQKKKPLIKMLTNPMMLTIFCDLPKSEREKTDVTTEAQLLNSYFVNMYKLKCEEDSDMDTFLRMIRILSKGAIDEKSECEYVDPKRILSFQTVVDIIPKGNEKNKVKFSHEIFREYFQATYIFQELIKINSNRLKKDQLFFLMDSYSHFSLFLAGQMLAESKKCSFLYNQPSIPDGQAGEDEPIGLKSLQSICSYVARVQEKKKIKVGQLIITNLFRLITFYRCYTNSSFDDYACFHSIADRAFYECPHVEKVFIPKSVVEIGYETFCRCPNLTTILYGGTREEWYLVDYPVSHLCGFDVKCLNNEIIVYHDDFSQQEFENRCIEKIDTIIVQKPTRQMAILRSFMEKNNVSIDGCKCPIEVKISNRVLLEFIWSSDGEFGHLKFLLDEKFRNCCIQNLKNLIMRWDSGNQIYARAADQVRYEIAFSKTTLSVCAPCDTETVRQALLELLISHSWEYIVDIVREKISDKELILFEFKTDDRFRSVIIHKIEPFVSDSESKEEALEKIKTMNDEFFINELFDEDITRVISIIILRYYSWTCLLKLVRKIQ